jgi:hypothetical protein
MRAQREGDGGGLRRRDAGRVNTAEVLVTAVAATVRRP